MSKNSQFTTDDLFDDLVSEGISSFEGGGDIGIVEFAEDFIFNGNYQLYPTQRTLLKAFYGEELFEDELLIMEEWCLNNRTTWVPGRHYKNLVWELGRRGTKSTCISIIILYEFYKLLSLEAPAAYYGLLPNSPLAIFVIAQSQEQVKETIFAQVRGYALGSDYFKGLEKSGKVEILQEEIRCADKNILVAAKHTNSKALVGYSLKLLVIDEAARFEYDELGNSKADLLWKNVGKACMGSNSPVLTDKGYIEAGKLLKAFDPTNPPTVVTYDPFTFEKQLSNQVVLWDNGIQTTRKIKTFSGRTEVTTLNHPFFVWKKGALQPEWVECSELKVGDLVASTKHLDLFSSNSDLHPDEARLIGYLWGDGGLTQPAVNFTNQSPEIIEDIKSILKAHFPNCELVPSDKNKDSEYRIAGKYHRVSDLLDRLREFNLTGYYSTNKPFPEAISSGTKEVVANFIKGLFSTDGYVVKATPQHIGIGLCNKELIKSLQRELVRFGIYACRRFKKVKNKVNAKNKYQIKSSVCWILEIRDQESIKAFRDEIGLVSKQEKLEAVANNFTTKVSRSRFNLYPKEVNLRIKTLQQSKKLPWGKLGIDYHWNRNQFSLATILKACAVLNDPVLENLCKNFFWEPITRISENEPEPTVGIAIEGTNIIGNPILSHNTSTFGKEGHKIAISSAWEPNDYIEQLYQVAERDPSTLGIRLRTWDMNLNPNMSEDTLKSSEDYINDPIAAALEYEGIRSGKQGTFMNEDNVKKAFNIVSLIDAKRVPLDITNKEGEVRHYVGVEISRMEHLNIGQSFAHCDYGVKKDSAAFATVHPIQLSDGKWAIQVDGFLVWKPSIDRNSKNEAVKRLVSFINAEELILKVCKARKVIKMTFDSFQSQHTIQKLHAAGISTAEMSTTIANQLLYYSITKNLIDQGLLFLPKDSTWSTAAQIELIHLVQLPLTGRIDHTKGREKDISDAIANATYNCYIHMAKSGLMSASTAGMGTISSKTRSKVNQAQGKDAKAKVQIGSAIKRLNKLKNS